MSYGQYLVCGACTFEFGECVIVSQGLVSQTTLSFLVSVLSFFEENAQITKPMSNCRLLSTTQIKSVAHMHLRVFFFGSPLSFFNDKLKKHIAVKCPFLRQTTIILTPTHIMASAQRQGLKTTQMNIKLDSATGLYEIFPWAA